MSVNETTTHKFYDIYVIFLILGAYLRAISSEQINYINRFSE